VVVVGVGRGLGGLKSGRGPAIACAITMQ